MQDETEQKYADLLRDLQTLYGSPEPKMAKALTPRPQRHNFVTAASLLRANRRRTGGSSLAATPAARQPTETRHELHARVRAAIPGVLAKAMTEFTAGRVTALDVATVEARLHRIKEIVG